MYKHQPNGCKNKQQTSTRPNERGLAFDDAAFFEFATALIAKDDRKEYGEIRYSALGLLDGRVHALVFTLIPDGIRVISFRKANKREVQRYGTVK